MALGATSINHGPRLESVDAPKVSSSPDAPGYRIVGRLGEGGQGSVWKALRLSDGCKVAIKLISAAHGSEPHARARFEYAFQTLASLDHPGIVRGLEQGELPDGSLWHATEYVSGRTLLEHLNLLDEKSRRAASSNRSALFPLPDVLGLICKICEAVEAAHRVGVIHRDLKPSNILVDDQGEPRLVDFGVAKGAGFAGAELVTLTDHFIGSPQYASPEQVEARPGRIDVRTDVYSLGVMLYQVLTGTFPYDVSGPLSRSFQQILHADPTPPRRHVPWIDSDLQAVVLKALAKDRERRYQSVADLREDLARYLRNEPVHAKGDRLGYILLKFARRHRAASIAAIVIFGLSILYGATMTTLYRRAARAESTATAQAEEARKKFRMARDSADFMISQIDSGLEHVPGATEVRRGLLQKAYAQVSELTKEETDDPSLLADIARTHAKLADIAQGLGNIPGAAEHVAAARAIWERLASARPEDAATRGALSIAIVRVGDIAAEQHDRETTRRCYDQALNIDEELAARFPDSATFLDNLAWSYNRLACLAKNRGDYQISADYCAKWRTIIEQLATAFPDHLNLQLELLLTLRQSPELSVSWGEDERPTDRMARSLREAAIADRLIASQPQNRRFLEQYIATQAGLGQAFEAVGNADQARTYFEKAFELAEVWIKREPEVLAARHAVGHTLSCLRNFEDHQGNFDRAWQLGLQGEEYEALQRHPQGQTLGCGQPFALYYDFMRGVARQREDEEQVVRFTRLAVQAARDLASCPDLAADIACHNAGMLLHSEIPDLRDPELALAMIQRSLADSEQPAPAMLSLLDEARKAATEPRGPVQAASTTVDSHSKLIAP